MNYAAIRKSNLDWCSLYVPRVGGPTLYERVMANSEALEEFLRDYNPGSIADELRRRMEAR